MPIGERSAWAVDENEDHRDNEVALTLHLAALQTHFCNLSFSVWGVVLVRTNQDCWPNQKSTRHFTVTPDLLFPVLS